MTKAECPKCQNTSFVVVATIVDNLAYDIGIVKCKSCDAAIGVVDYQSYMKIRNIEEKLDRIKA